MGHCLVCEHKSFREKSLVPPAHLVFVSRIFYIFANGSRAIIAYGSQLLLLVTKNSEYLTQLKLPFHSLMKNINIDLRHARKGSNAASLYFEGLPNCAMVINPFQLPRVIIYESVQLVLSVIADTQRSRS